MAVLGGGAPRRTLWFAVLWLSAVDVNASCEGEGNAVVVGMGFVVVIVAGSGRGCGADFEEALFGIAVEVAPPSDELLFE